eukprot:TRINITY_DN2614_c0_g2_i3.p4 TRINITY_DN2614_c0_g2~~TRINITY_DN2614_c0_g2_i3.p4  ORF type:complete len:309 (+),score=93.45 TRINITY_DN2614_c0_g2_i3:1347-2273(+)
MSASDSTSTPVDLAGQAESCQSVPRPHLLSAAHPSQGPYPPAAGGVAAGNPYTAGFGGAAAANPVVDLSTVPAHCGAPVQAGVVTYRACSNVLTGSTLAVLKAYHKASFTTYTVRLRDVNAMDFLGGVEQGWNKKYSAAQKIFGNSLQSRAVRMGIKTQRATLYFGGTLSEKKGTLETGHAFLDLIHQGRDDKNQAVFFTYVINLSGEWNFCHTGASFLRDMLSKHAMHANCAEVVRYAGEFHVTTHPGTGAPMLVVDNNSGTFAPDQTQLPRVAALFRHNFPDIAIDAWDREDPRLKAAIKACPTRS